MYIKNLFESNNLFSHSSYWPYWTYYLFFRFSSWASFLLFEHSKNTFFTCFLDFFLSVSSLAGTHTSWPCRYTLLSSIINFLYLIITKLHHLKYNIKKYFIVFISKWAILQELNQSTLYVIKHSFFTLMYTSLLASLEFILESCILLLVFFY